MDRNLKIFLCHASPDKAKVRRLYHELREAGLDPWLDEENILPGQDWDEAIRDAIRTSDYFLACLSKAAIDRRGFFQKEIKLALDVLDEMPEGKIYLIPIRLDNCEIPQRLRHRQAVDLFGFRTRGFTRLLMTIASQSPGFVKSIGLDDSSRDIQSDFQNGRFRQDEGNEPSPSKADLTNLHNLLQKKEKDLESASEETRKMLLYLAGPDAAYRGCIRDESESRNIRCSDLHRIDHLWSSLAPEALAKQFPRVVIERKVEIEWRLFPELRAILERLRQCGLDCFVWYMRHDGEILSGPLDRWLYPCLQSLRETAPVAYGLLNLSYTLSTLWSIPRSVLAQGLSRVEVPEWKEYGWGDGNTQSVINDSLSVLAEYSLIYRLSPDSYSLHSFVQDYLSDSMEDEELAEWVSLVIKAIDLIFPDPEEDMDWPSQSTISLHLMLFADEGTRSWRVMKVWQKAWRSHEGANLLTKLGVHVMRREKYVGSKRKAAWCLASARSFLIENYGEDDIRVKNIAQYQTELEEKHSANDL